MSDQGRIDAMRAQFEAVTGLLMPEIVAGTIVSGALDDIATEEVDAQAFLRWLETGDDPGDIVARAFAAYGIPWPQSHDPAGMYTSGAIDNPSTAPDADQAIERAGKLVEALDDATAALVYHLLHARGCRVMGGSYTDDFRRKWAKR